MGKDLRGKQIGKGITQREDKRYMGRFVNKQGNRITYYNFKLNEVKRWLSDAKYEDDHGLAYKGNTITLNEWYTTWTETCKRKVVKSTTIYKNDSYYKARIKNQLGSIPLYQIKNITVQLFLNNLLDDGLSHGTVSNIYFLLKGMFQKALDNEYISKNPCDGIVLPKAIKSERRVLTEDEQKNFFQFTTGYKQINVLKLAITTGARIGEILGLKWDTDIDFENRTIQIQRTLHYGKASSPNEKSKFFFTTPKTNSSIRIIPMSNEVFDILKAQKLKQANERKLKGHLWLQIDEMKNLVFTCSNGGPINYFDINQAISQYVSKMNIIEIFTATEEKRLPKIFASFTCHALRHSFASRCDEKNISPKVLQYVLGHSKVEMTDYYTYATPERKMSEILNLKILY